MADQRLAVLNKVDRNALESLLMDFERGWNREAFSQVCERLGTDARDEYRRLAMEELAKVDLHRQWSDGATPLLEDYIRRFPSLGPVEKVSVDLVLAEYEARRAVDPGVDLAEYQSRYPDQFDDLKRLAEQLIDSKPSDAPKPASQDAAAQASIDTSRVQKARDTAVGNKERAKATELPTEFGRYRILRELGAGAMGRVYLAHDSQLDRQVAIKTPSFLGASDSDLVTRFYREARAAAKIQHRNICPVYDVGEIDNRHFISMAFVKGRCMSDFIKPDKLPPQRTSAALIHRLALALAEAHRHNVIHRDLKPANIMIDLKKEPVVMDFGLARQTDVESRVTQSGMAVGTPAYMSPEQIRGNIDEVDAKSDIYSLGVIFYELLTGRLPFRGPIANVVYSIVHEEPLAPSSVRPEIEPELEAICAKMMAKDRGQRFQSMDDVALSLKDLLKGHRQPETDDADSKSSSSDDESDSDIPKMSETAALNAFFAAQALQDPMRTAIEPGVTTMPSMAVKPQVNSGSGRKRGRAKRLAAGLGGAFLCLAGVIIYLSDGTRVEIQDGTSAIIKTTPQGTLESLTTNAADDEDMAGPDLVGTGQSALQPTTAALPIGRWVGLLETAEQLKYWEAFNGLPEINEGTVSLQSGPRPGNRLYGKRLTFPLPTGVESFVFHVRHNKLDGFATSHGIRFGDAGLSVSFFERNKYEFWVQTGNENSGGKANATHRSAKGYGSFVDCDYVVVDNVWSAYLDGEKIFTFTTPRQPPSHLFLSVRQSSVRWQDISVMRLSDEQVAAYRRGELPKYSPDVSLAETTLDQTPTPSGGLPADKLLFQLAGDATQIAVSPDGRNFAISGKALPGKFAVWSLETGERITQFEDTDHPDIEITNLSYSPDGQSLLYCSGNQVRVVSSAGGIRQASFDFPAPPTLVVFPQRTWAMALYAMAPFNDQNADRGDRSEETTGLRIWDWTNGSVLFDGPAPVESAMYPAVSPDERFVTFGVKASHVRYTVMVDGSNVRLETPTEYGQKYRVNGPLVFSQDGKLAATSVYSRRCMASVIDATTGEFVCEIDSVTARRTNRPLQSGCKLGFSPDGTQIVVADHTGRVAIWSVQDGALLKEIDQYKKTADLSAPGLAVSKHGGIIVGGSSTERRLSINHF